MPGVYKLMDSFLRELSHQPPQPITILAFEMKLLHELGQSPNFAESKLTPGAKKILTELTVQDWSALARIKLSAAQTQELQQFLHGFILYHLERIPAGRTAALHA